MTSGVYSDDLFVHHPRFIARFFLLLCNSHLLRVRRWRAGKGGFRQLIDSKGESASDTEFAGVAPNCFRSRMGIPAL
jgi:hypothetical protein